MNKDIKGLSDHLKKNEEKSGTELFDELCYGIAYGMIKWTAIGFFFHVGWSLF